jgi:hypothetical protein
MKQLPWMVLAALLGAAVSSPAQVSIEAGFGGHWRSGVVIRAEHQHGHRTKHRGPHRCVEHDRGCLPVPHVGRSHGHWQTICEQVWIPGYWREEHVPPRYEWVTDACGHSRQVLVDGGGCRRVWVPGRYESRSRRVWVTC